MSSHSEPAGNSGDEHNTMNSDTPTSLAKAVEGQQVLLFSGKISKVFDRTVGSNDHGDYSIQNIICTDPSGKGPELKVKLDGLPALTKASVGKSITVAARKGGKDGKSWVGTKLVEEIYKSKTSLVLKATAAAVITIGSNVFNDPDGTAQAPEPEAGQEPPGDAPEPSDNPPQKPESPAQPRQAEPTPEVKIKRRLGQLLNLEWQIHKAGDILRKAYEKAHGEPMPESIYAGMTGRMFIQLTREGLDFAIPYKLAPELAEAATAPETQTEEGK